MQMPLDSCAGWRGEVSVVAMGAPGARHPRTVVVLGTSGSVLLPGNLLFSCASSGPHARRIKDLSMLLLTAEF